MRRGRIYARTGAYFVTICTQDRECLFGEVVGNFKSVTTRRINRIRKTPGARVWQRNYYERVIHDERALNAIRRYIQNNPGDWSENRVNPLA